MQKHWQQERLVHNSPEQQHNNSMNTTIAAQSIIKKMKNKIYTNFPFLSISSALSIIWSAISFFRDKKSFSSC